MAIDHVDAGIVQTATQVSNGKLGGFTYLRTADQFPDINAVAGGVAVGVWTPTKTARLMGGSISVSVACSVVFTDSVGGAVIYRTPQLLANTPHQFDLYNGRLLSTIGGALNMQTSVASTVTGTLFGCDE